MYSPYSVKDKDNIVTYDHWSCGEYSNNLNSFVKNNTTVILTTEHTVIGDKCIKLTKDAAAEKNYAIGCNFSLSEEDIGKTLTAQMSLKSSPNASVYLQLTNQEADNVKSSAVTVSETEFLPCSISQVITEDLLNLRFLTYLKVSQTNDYLFLDNIKIVIQ